MPVGSMQEEGGILFLWVTGRAMELGRECLKAWGYERIDEMVWVKTNQLQGLIRTGECRCACCSAQLIFLAFFSQVELDIGRIIRKRYAICSSPTG